MRIEHNIDLKPFNTFGLSSVAERLVHIRSEAELAEYFEGAQARPSLVLGGGSNLLLSRDIPGTVLKIEIPGFQLVHEDDEHVYVKAGAGELWHAFVLRVIDQQWAGIENLSLIPGNVGAAPMQNIGAYGVEIKDVFHELEAYIIGDKSMETFSLKDCAFGYRESVFKRALKDRAIITSVTFKLNKSPSFNTSYGAINKQLESMGVKTLTIKAVSDAVIAIRQSKLPDPAVLGNAGSFFKNPVIDRVHFESLQKQYADLVAYPSGDDKVKIAAGWLIERAGFKGKNLGSHGVHDKQALVLVNYGGATGSEIMALSENIMAVVGEMFGIDLEREVNIV